MTWQDITPQRGRPHEVECTADPCTNPEHDHEPLAPADDEMIFGKVEQL